MSDMTPASLLTRFPPQMSFPCHRSTNPRALSLFLVGLSWPCTSGSSKPPGPRGRRCGMVLQRLPLLPLRLCSHGHSSESRGVANDSVNAMVDFYFEQLPACIRNPRLPAVPPLPPLSSALRRADQVRGLPRAAAGCQVVAPQPRTA